MKANPHKIPFRYIIFLFITLITGIATAQPNGEGSFNEEPPEVLPIEISFSGSTAIGPNDTWLWESGFGFSYLVSDNIRVGIEELGYASTSILSGNRDAISIAPMVEYHQQIGSTPLDVVAAIGIPLQLRFGADVNTKLGVAPSLRLGVDFNTSDLFSIGIIERISYVLSDAYIMSEHGLPSGAIVYATGIAFKFHF